ncbi:hypothetical protein HG535_0E01750 [Zygotorulaspora mrakii]|uniref:BAR domain-containing protein n=1 Tax=Zygotorulaspora mrakii TaxID=42260 RepID=A0A7H9B363_ZYGMR|nr:uncharacterized protein HG535_0E01750 [Zygotorulaspora mrakii]QLG73091.1 hypothetical protein HG535_0E01750 [Zygotorulaspora mrakii]
MSSSFSPLIASGSPEEQNHDKSEIKIPKRRSSSGSHFLRQNWHSESRLVDPHFNEQHIRFKCIFSNLKALLQSCENYKLSIRSFFYQTMMVTESFRRLLDDTALTTAGGLSGSQVSSPSSPSSPGDSNPRTVDILRNFYLSAGLAETLNKHNRIDIERLNRQVSVISKRVENDMVFFESSVQMPINTLMHICCSISQTIRCREQANLELSGLCDKMVKSQQSRSHSNTARKIEAANKLDKKFALAKAKYETLNLILKRDLETLLKTISADFMKEWFKIFYFTTLRISYSLHYFCCNCPEFKKLQFNEYPRSSRSSPRDPNGDSIAISMAAILQKFKQDHYFVFHEIENLEIVKTYNRI